MLGRKLKCALAISSKSRQRLLGTLQVRRPQRSGLLACALSGPGLLMTLHRAQWRTRLRSEVLKSEGRLLGALHGSGGQTNGQATPERVTVSCQGWLGAGRYQVRDLNWGGHLRQLRCICPTRRNFVASFLSETMESEGKKFIIMDLTFFFLDLDFGWGAMGFS